MNYNKFSKKVRNTVAVFAILSVIAVVLCFMLFRCDHEWLDATCTSPKTCAKCNKTEGETTPHSLTEANYQSPATCTVCGVEVGAPLTPYFEEHGYKCSITELNKPYDYHTRSSEDASIPVEGHLIVTDYETFLSDETHEGMEGYEWKKVKFNFYIPLSEMENGGRVAINAFDFYRENNKKFDRLIESGEQVDYPVSWNGIEYNDGIQVFSFTENRYGYEDTFLHTDCWFVSVKSPHD